MRFETKSSDVTEGHGAAASLPKGLLPPGFELYDKPEKKWLRWSPRIWIGPGKDPGAGAGSKAGSSKPGAAPAKQKPEKVHFKEGAKQDPKSHHWFQKLFHRGSD